MKGTDYRRIYCPEEGCNYIKYRVAFLFWPEFQKVGYISNGTDCFCPLGGWGKRPVQGDLFYRVFTLEQAKSCSIPEPMLELMTVTLTVTFTPSSYTALAV